MKLAVLSESSADEAALRILVDGILGHPTEPIGLNKFATRVGWQARLNILPAVVKELYYRTDGDALVFVLDSDKSAVHAPGHDLPGGADNACRLCCALQKLEQVGAQLRPVAGRRMLKFAVGLAVPCLEAWLLCGKDPHVSEAAWVIGLETGKYPYQVKALKSAVYGHDHPSIQLETTRMTEEARRLVGSLNVLESFFPAGFGALAKTIRGW